MSRSLIPTTGVVLLLALPAGPVHPQSTTFLLLRGTDTVAVERYARGATLDGEMIMPATGVRTVYTIALAPGGTVLQATIDTRPVNGDSAAPPSSRITTTFGSDSVVVESTLENAPSTRHAQSAGGALFPFVNPSFAMIELAIRHAVGRERTGDDTITLFAMPAARAVPAPLERLGDDSVRLALGSVQVRLAIDGDGNILGGVIPAQGLSIIRGEADALAGFESRRIDYGAPEGLAWTAEDVVVPTSMGHQLAGTVTTPAGPGPWPAVITSTGSGLQDRDGSLPSILPGYRPFRQLAEALTEAGVVVLRMDDRGFGGSGGNAATATTADFAEDIAAGIRWLRGRPGVDPDRIGVIGHSEGGIIAPMLAAEDPKLAAIVLMAAPGLSGREVIRHQNRVALERSPQVPLSVRDSALVRAMQQVDSLAGVQPWLRYFLDHDPLPVARRVTTPALILHGATDRQVTPDQAELLAGAMRAAGNGDVTMTIFPATNHLFLADRDGHAQGYSRLPDARMRPEVVETIVAWLRSRLAGR